MFEKATRLKLRFGFRGSCSAEDLWDLSLEDLDTIYKELAGKAKAQEEESLLQVKSGANEVLDLQIDIVKHIFRTKMSEQEARENEALNAERKQKILAVIAEKQDDALRNLPVEELQELVSSMG